MTTRAPVDRRPSVTFTVPTRESAAVKAIRLLAQGRVRLHSVHIGRCAATVFGDTGTWTVGCGHSRWHCDCPNAGDRCSHIAAVKLVTDLSGKTAP